MVVLVAHDTRGGGAIVSSVPLHPALVHIPLGLALVIPLVAAGLAWALWTGRIDARVWLAIIALQAVLVGAALVAMNTGEREADRVEAVVPRAALRSHEAAADQFLWAAAATLMLTGLVVITRRTAATRALALVSVAGTIVVAGIALRVGHAGGQLVYVHNAGAAYASRAVAHTQPAAEIAAPPVEKRGHRDRQE
jgi:uncharacterized membrane protein